ncbi:unnamed protein product [Rotaria sp. Silwood1]|nr:unnamed protein product [Rotaria sp. Silwood1]CAF1648527.1 unnamed protein product [Rotaria sp. Silwood1]CAF3823962.1 unnamed protein product [Rotaria sp. Silwood1]CAF3854843.1 unnamed protein product [Rotaria sp. Silwood1]CAF3901291.1 unnamed protein product [Rotaria sp. Silwood1]
MHSKSPSTKRHHNNEAGNNILQYFKRTKANEKTTTTVSVLTSQDNLISNVQMNMLGTVENVEESTAAGEVADNRSSSEASEHIHSNESEKENHMISASTSHTQSTTSTTATTLNCPCDNSCLHQIGVKLRIMETLLHPCQHLMKLSTSINICPEVFVEETKIFVDKLLEAGNDLKMLCTDIITETEMKRNKITIMDSKEDELINREPGYYDVGHKFTEKQLRYLVSVGPLQVKIEEYPKNRELHTAGKTCKFASKWYDEYPYLEYSIKRDAAFCFTCRLFPDGPGSEKHTDAWTSNGVATWNKMKSQGIKKKGKLEQHFSSATHKSSVDRYLNFKNKKLHVDLMLDSNRMKEDQEQEMILQLNKQVIVTLLDSARYLARQGLAFRRNPESEGCNFVQLVYLQRRNNQVFNDWFFKTKLEKYQNSYLSHQSQDEYVQLLGEAVESLVIEEINKSPFISIMADSTPDTSHREMYSIVIRFTKNYQVEERLLSVQELPSKVGEEICLLLLKTLQRKGISTEKLVAQCYDNAPNMGGSYKGVQACVTNHLNREILHIPCSAHNSNLAVEYACHCSVEYINLFMLLQELYNYFTLSIKRCHVLREALDKSPYGLNIKSLSDTRWTANYESIHAIIESYDEIIYCFQLIEEGEQFDKESKLQGKNLRNKFISYEIIVLLKFMENITRTTNSLTSHLQSKHLDILSSMELIANTLKLIKIMRNDDQSLKNILLLGKKHIEPYDVDIDKEFNRLHRFRQPSRRIDPKPATVVQLTRESFYLKLFREILDHLYTTYSAFLNVLNEKLKWFINVTPGRIENLTLNECQHMCEVIPKLTSPPLLFTEFQLLSDQIKECNDMNEIAKLLQQCGHLYPKVSSVYNYILTLPITTATNERTTVNCIISQSER